MARCLQAGQAEHCHCWLTAGVFLPVDNRVDAVSVTLAGRLGTLSAVHGQFVMPCLMSDLWSGSRSAFVTLTCFLKFLTVAFS